VDRDELDHQPQRPEYHAAPLPPVHPAGHVDASHSGPAAIIL
jgi:hypothetical protein